MLPLLESGELQWRSPSYQLAKISEELLQGLAIEGLPFTSGPMLDPFQVGLALPDSPRQCKTEEPSGLMEHGHVPGISCIQFGALSHVPRDFARVVANGGRLKVNDGETEIPLAPAKFVLFVCHLENLLKAAELTINIAPHECATGNETANEAIILDIDGGGLAEALDNRPLFVALGVGDRTDCIIPLQDVDALTNSVELEQVGIIIKQQKSIGVRAFGQAIASFGRKDALARLG